MTGIIRPKVNEKLDHKWMEPFKEEQRSLKNSALTLRRGRPMWQIQSPLNLFVKFQISLTTLDIVSINQMQWPQTSIRKPIENIDSRTGHRRNGRASLSHKRDANERQRERNKRKKERLLWWMNSSRSLLFCPHNGTAFKFLAWFHESEKIKHSEIESPKKRWRKRKRRWRKRKRDWRIKCFVI